MSKAATELNITTTILLSLALYFPNGMTLDKSFSTKSYYFLKENTSFLLEGLNKFNHHVYLTQRMDHCNCNRRHCHHVCTAMPGCGESKYPRFHIYLK